MVLLTIVTSYDASTESSKLAKQRSGNLPTCQWGLRPGFDFSCFLSHYKMEAGGEARYLKE
jgi:hypothetical protein